MGQFRVQNCRLQTIHAAIDAFHDVIALSTVSRECPHPVGQSIVIGHSASSVPIRTQVFARIKGKDRNVAEGSHELAVVPGEMCLSAILEHPKMVLFCN